MRSIAWIVLALSPAFAQKTVTNPMRPSAPPYTLSLVEDLRFGGGDDAPDHMIWPDDNSTVSADAAGNMYVSDIAGQRVLAFDAAGRFLRIVAGPGQGPGEFQGRPFFQVLKGGGALASDVGLGSPPRFYRYDGDLKFEKAVMQVGSAGLPSNGYFSPEGTRFICTLMSSDQAAMKMSLRYVVTDLELKALVTLSEHQTPMPDFNNIMDPKMWRGHLTHQFREFFSGSGAAAVDGKGRIWVAKPGREYRITRLSADGKTPELVVEREADTVRYSQADMAGITEGLVSHFRKIPIPGLAELLNDTLIAAALEDADLPGVKNAVMGMLTTDRNELVVIHDIRPGTGEQIADIFSEEGVYLCQVKMAGQVFFNYFQHRPRMLFRNGRAYTVEVPHDGGDVQVVRYKVTR